MPSTEITRAILHCVYCEKDPEPWAISRLLNWIPETGKFTWKPRPIGCFRSPKSWGYWNSVYGGQVAGAENWGAPKSDPRRAPVCILITFTDWRNDKVRRLLAHRMAWVLHNGPIGEGLEIDHIDRNPFNNVLSNLRICTHEQNCQNRSISSKNTSGFMGVHFDRFSKKFHATGRKDGKSKVLGKANTPEEAAKIRVVS